MLGGGVDPPEMAELPLAGPCDPPWLVRGPPVGSGVAASPCMAGVGPPGGPNGPTHGKLPAGVGSSSEPP